MKRNEFLSSLLLIPAAAMLKPETDQELDKLRKQYPHANFDRPVPPITIDLAYLPHPRTGVSPAQVMDLYLKTGVLVWVSKPGDPHDFKPFREIKPVV